MRIGLISDTHGYLNPRVYHHFEGVQRILHAGDVGSDTILLDLEEIAPVSAVSGNVDGPPTKRCPLKFCETIAGIRICMTHGHLLDPRDYNGSALRFFEGESPRIVIHGHSHKGKCETENGVTFINPGAACRPRFRDVASVAILEVEPRGTFFVRFIQLEPVG